MQVRQVEELLGINRETIRYYINEGLLDPKREDNGYRNYSDEDICILKRVMIMRQLEISIEDIKRILKGELDWNCVLAQSKKLIRQKQIITNDAAKICRALLDSKDRYFDPEPYFKNYLALFRKDD